MAKKAKTTKSKTPATSATGISAHERAENDNPAPEGFKQCGVALIWGILIAIYILTMFGSYVFDYGSLDFRINFSFAFILSMIGVAVILGFFGFTIPEPSEKTKNWDMAGEYDYDSHAQPGHVGISLGNNSFKHEHRFSDDD